MALALTDLMRVAEEHSEYLTVHALPPDGDASWMPVATVPSVLPAALDGLNAVYGSTGYRTPAAVLQASIWWTVGAACGAALVHGDAVPSLGQETLTVRILPGGYGFAAGAGASAVAGGALGPWLADAAQGPLGRATDALAAAGGGRPALLWAIAFDELAAAAVYVAEQAGWDAGRVDADLLRPFADAAGGTALEPRATQITRVSLPDLAPDGSAGPPVPRARWERTACCRRFDVREGRVRCLDCPAIPVARRHRPDANDPR